MRIAVVFDSPHEWTPQRHFEEMVKAIKKRAETEPDMSHQVANALIKNGHEVTLIGVHEDLRDLSARLGEFKPELVFNATEAYLDNSTLDYLVPALLEAEGYRYTGAPPIALLVTRNKSMSKKVLAFHGINVPGFRSYRVGEKPTGDDGLRFPLIIKPLQADASEGISQASIVHDASSLAERVAWVHERFLQPAIAEEYIEGRELYATVLGNGDNITLLPLVEMVFEGASERPEERIATQAAKWDMKYRKRRGIKNVFARPIAKTAREQLEHAARISYRAFWLRDYARIDVRLTPDNQVWFLEANANPFLSYGHDSAESAHKAGLRYNAFIQRIVDEAMGRDA